MRNPKIKINSRAFKNILLALSLLGPLIPSTSMAQNYTHEFSEEKKEGLIRFAVNPHLVTKHIFLGYVCQAFQDTAYDQLTIIYRLKDRGSSLSMGAIHNSLEKCIDEMEIKTSRKALGHPASTGLFKTFFDQCLMSAGYTNDIVFEMNLEKASLGDSCQ